MLPVDLFVFLSFFLFVLAQVVPGVGDFSRRYFDARAVVEAEAAAEAKARAAESGRQWWWRRR